VESVAGGQLPPDQDERLRAELVKTSGEPWCGLACCLASPITTLK